MIITTLFLLSCTAISQPIPKLKMTDVVAMFNQPNDTVYVVNFWATFCKPCVGEIPHFISITQKYAAQKVKLLLVSLDLKEDYPQKIRAFAQRFHFNTNISWLNETNADIFCPMIDPKWSGAIPATIFVNNKKGYKKFYEDELNAVDFEKALKAAIGE